VGLYPCNSDQNFRRFDGSTLYLFGLIFQWTAITTVQGGGYLENMVTAIWPSYADFPNKLPADANITSGSLLLVFLEWFVQTGVSMLPMYRLRYFFAFKAIVVPPAFMALFLWGYSFVY
jgi:cytosine/uracil/thiamine/allantoin permease